MAAKKSSSRDEGEKNETGAAEGAPSFEQAVQRLGEIVEKLEGGDLPLEESLAMFEQGIRLSREAQSRLDAAEKRVEQLLGFDENGRPLVTPVETE